MSGRASLGQRLRRINPPVAIGLGLLLLGLALSIRGMAGRGQSSDASFSGALSSALTRLYVFAVRGDDRIREAQGWFNAVVVDAFLEALSPGQRRTLDLMGSTARGLLGDLFSPGGLLTLLVVAAGYPIARRAVLARRPPPAARAESPE